MLTWTRPLLYKLPKLAMVCVALTALIRCPAAMSAPTSKSEESTSSKTSSSVYRSSGTSNKASPAPAKTNSLRIDGADSLRLRQHSKPSGEEEIEVSPYGIKITNLRNQIVSLYPAPYKVVYYYNSKTKKIYSCPIKLYKSPYASSMALLKSITFSDVVTTKYKEALYKGCTADFAKIPQGVVLQRFKERQKGDLVSRSPFLLEMITTAKVPVAPAAAGFLCKYYGLQQKTGLVLEMKYETFSNLKHEYLTTDKVEPKQFKPSDFAPPTNYFKAKNDGDVLLDNDSEGSMNLMIMDH